MRCLHCENIFYTKRSLKKYSPKLTAEYRGDVLALMWLKGILEKELITFWLMYMWLGLADARYCFEMKVM